MRLDVNLRGAGLKSRCMSVEFGSADAARVVTQRNSEVCARIVRFGTAAVLPFSMTLCVRPCA